MAWRLTIGGVDQTAAVDSFSTSVSLNDRARATVVVGDLMPDRYAELISYAPDGVTPLFGGLILQRSFLGRNPYDPTYQLTLEVGDWFTYADWCYTTKAYPVAVTLKQVLADLVSEHLGQYGVSLDPAQVDGPTLAAFTWTAKRVADALRELSDRTQYVVRIDPAKRLRMFIPATLTAPVAMTEAAPHCHDLTWRDSDRTPYNTIVLNCGPGGPAEVYDERHAGDGTTRSWPLDAPFIAMIGALSVYSEGGGGYPVGIYGVDDMPWTVDLDANTMRQRADQAVIAAGDYWWINYHAQFPFTVTRSTGDTPVVEHAEDRPDVLSIPVGEEIADSLLAQAQEAPREATINTDTDGFVPGQALTIDLATTRSIAGNFLITAVALTIVLDTAAGDRLWQYTIEAIESPIYQGSYLDAWREIAGLGAGSTTISVPPGDGGGGGGGGGMLPLPAGQIYIGNSASAAVAQPVSGDVLLSQLGVMTVAHVANSATTATPANVANTIVSRDSNGDSYFRATWANYVSGPMNQDLLILAQRDQPTVPANITVQADNLGIHASTGTITLYTDTQDVLINPAGNIQTNPGTKYVYPSTGYSVNLGAIYHKYLTVHAAELWVETLVAQQTMATIGGRILVGPTTMLARDLAPTDTTIYVKHNSFQLGAAGVEYGSKIYMESQGRFEAMQITVFPVSDGGTGPPAQESDGSYAYTVQRDLDGSGANQWYAGDALFDTGKEGSGFIDLYSLRGVLSGYGPTIVGNVRTKTPPYGLYTDIAPRWAIGNLDGLYGYSGTVFGAAFGDNAAAWLKIDPTNGVRIGHSTTVVSQIDAAGNAYFQGRVVAASGQIGGWNILPTYLYAPLTNTSLAFNSSIPSIEIGDPRPTAWAASAAGIWMGNDGGVYKFRACSADGTRGFFWDGTTAIFRGDGSGVTNINGGNITTDTITATQIAAGTITATEIANGTITSTQIAARAITADRIAVGALTATEIAANTITGDRIAVNTITADRLNVGALSAISANLGTVTAGTITGVTITGVTINGTTINGSTVHGGLTTLDSNGLTMSPSGSGGDSATIKLGTIQLWGNNANTLIDSGNLDVYGWMHAQGDISGTACSITGDISASGYVSASGVLACGTMNTVGSGTRAVYFNFGNNQFVFWTGAASSRSDIQPWVPPADPLALLSVPIVSHAAGGGREIGIVVEALAAAAPEAVYRNAAGAPDGVREDVMQIYLLEGLKALDRRLRLLEAAPGHE